MSLEENLSMLNPWWTTGQVNPELAKPYRRKAFAEAKRLLAAYRQVLMLVGLRRVGKSTILYQLISDLLKGAEPRHVVYFTFDASSSGLIEILKAYARMTGIEWKKEKVYVFLDELQKLPDWDSQLKVLYDSFPNLRLVVSGSASLDLEERVTNNLAGRYFKVEIEPLDLVEFYELKRGVHVDRIELYWEELETELSNYVLRPFPEIVNWPENDAKTYIREMVVSKATRGDIPDTFQNANFRLIEDLVSAFYKRPGMIVNVDDLSRQLRISKTTLENHMFYLNFSRLIKTIKNFRPSIMAESRKMKKVYPYNASLALAYGSMESGPLMETLVLGAIGASHYWRQGGKEVDFLITDPLTAIEVKAGTDVSSTELTGLKYLGNKYRCRQVVIYQGSRKRENGVEFLPILDLLAKGRKAIFEVN